MIAPLTSLQVLWTVWFVAWMLAAPWTAGTVARQSSAARLAHSAPLAAGAVLLFFRPGRLGPLTHPLFGFVPWVAWGHPIYTGLLLAVIGTALARDSVAGLVGLGFLVAGLTIKIRQEERLLLEHFGPAYQAYRAKVPALIPRPW